MRNPTVYLCAALLLCGCSTREPTTPPVDFDTFDRTGKYSQNPCTFETDECQVLLNMSRVSTTPATFDNGLSFRSQFAGMELDRHADGRLVIDVEGHQPAEIHVIPLMSMFIGSKPDPVTLPVYLADSQLWLVHNVLALFQSADSSQRATARAIAEHMLSADSISFAGEVTHGGSFDGIFTLTASGRRMLLDAVHAPASQPYNGIDEETKSLRDALAAPPAGESLKGLESMKRLHSP